MIALAVGLVLAGPGAVSAHPLGYTKWWTGVSTVHIAGIKYDLTFTLWQNNDNGYFHAEANGYPAGYVGLYNNSGKLIVGASKAVAWADINTNEAGGTLQACGQATLPADNGQAGNPTCSGIVV
ncbi:hypothetical protein [Fodinicola feengrottensis]|nr:hypothetical protein [Fodinicola feengrottensis]